MTKRRGKRRSRRQRDAGSRPSAPRPESSEVRLALQRAERSIERGRPERAIELLETLLASAPGSPDLHYTLGHARALSGDIFGGLDAFERASRLSQEPDYALSLATTCLQAGLLVHALRAFRRLSERDVPKPLIEDARYSVDALEQDVAEAARQLDVSLDQAEQGLYELEQGQRAINENDFSAAMAANRRAIERLGDWPPPHNNLSQALYYDGQLEEAIEEVRRVLADHPRNIQALANGIRFLAWSGREEEARELWAQAEDVVPKDADERLKKGEAAAILAEHESVYQTLKPLGEAAAEEEMLPRQLSRARYLLALAEANTGRLEQAKQRLRALRDTAPFAAEMLNALRAGRSGVGWADHFPYFRLLELLPADHINGLLDLVAQEDDMRPRRFRRRIRRFVERFPQLVRVGEKMIWEEQQPEAGIDLLRTVDTPEAHAALRRFGTSQAGSDDARIRALTALADAGEIKEGEAVRAWLEGAWRDVTLQAYDMSGEMTRDSPYAPRLANMLNRALVANKSGDIERAEELFERVLEFDPDVKEAYNNLGAIYAGRDEHERARRMFRKAAEIDPLYVFPLCNLAIYHLDERRLEEAEELLAPLEDVEGLFPQEEAFYSYTRARLLVERGRFKAGRRLLETVLELRPGYEPAQNLLRWIEEASPLVGWMSDAIEASEAYFERSRERDRDWRERLQQELDTLKPTLSQALPLYTKKSLTETARRALPWGGWSTLRKDELIAELVEALTDRENLARLVEDLGAEEKEALRAVLDRGGAMAWDDFDARWDNDLEEPRHWEYHTPETTMGQLRLHGLLVEATVDEGLHVVVPVGLRQDLGSILD